MAEGQVWGMKMGLFVLRVGIGIMFICHGWPKLVGGPETWTGLGQAMGTFGITFAPAFWGFMAAFAETAGGAALLAGVLVRPFCVLLLITMVVAAGMHIGAGDGFAKISHPLEMMIVFVALFLSGPGAFSLSQWIPGLRNKRFG